MLPGPATQIADDIGELHVHLGQHFLHALNARANRLHMAPALAPIGAHDADVCRGMEGIPQQPIRVQLQ